MVFESILPVRMAEKRPIEMLPLAFLYGSVGVLLALWIFPANASLACVFFGVMALLPLMVQIIHFEAKKSESSGEVDALLHKQTVPFFVFMFLGLILCYAAWAIFLPYVSSVNLFQLQINVIQQINANALHGYAFSAFTKILINNIRVLAFCLLFSFIFGAGAIFILAWNASVISVAIADTTRGIVSAGAAAVGAAKAASYFHAFGLALMRYMIHGIPEIGGYFVGGLAGGIISVAILKHNVGSKKFKKAMFDALNLTIIALFILFLAAILEVWVSPLIPV